MISELPASKIKTSKKGNLKNRPRYNEMYRGYFVRVTTNSFVGS